ncbi:MAG: adenosylcobinamide-GDP ribazoletransferase [Desulfohalobiaceae bacterium]|nr:adenosylcobinamide-GDP ribazoletransferase [Desulfohalobiaceae bacterium]
MPDFWSAFQFLTIIPLGRSNDFRPGTMLPWFPVVGLCLGLFLALFNLLALSFWPAEAVAVLDVLLLICATGALHLDGAADAADGMLGTRPREKALEIMKDSRVGAMGLVAVVSVLAVKWAGMYAVLSGGTAWRTFLIFLLVPAFSRGSMTLGIRFLEYGRPSGGTGHGFFDSEPDFRMYLGLFLLMLLSLFLGLQGIWLIFCFALITALVLYYYKQRMDCITGDMLGAMCETNEALLFLAAGMSF